MCDHEKDKNPELAEIVLVQRKIFKRLSVLKTEIEYNRQLLESISEHFPAVAAKKEMQKLLKVQMGSVRSLMENANFQGKDQILNMLDTLVGGKV